MNELKQPKVNLGDIIIIKGEDWEIVEQEKPSDFVTVEQMYTDSQNPPRQAISYKDIIKYKILPTKTE